MIGERTGASSQSPWLLASRGGIDGHPCTTNAPNRVKGGSGMKIAFFGSSLLSAYWNGAATYYRGMLRALAALGHEISFFEPDAYDRQANRDIDPPHWADVQVYAATVDAARQMIARAADADVVVKASGVGIFDDRSEEHTSELQSLIRTSYAVFCLKKNISASTP